MWASSLHVHACAGKVPEVCEFSGVFNQSLAVCCNSTFQSELGMPPQAVSAIQCQVCPDHITNFALTPQR